MILLHQENVVKKEIPDNSNEGLVNVIKIAKSGKVAGIKISVDVKHPYVGDLKVNVTAPSGKKITLHNREGGKTANLKKTFTADFLKDFIGEKARGEWQIQCLDFAPRDSGTLESWNVDLEIEKCTDKSEIFIPDEDAAGLTSIQMCNFNGTVKDIKLDLNIAHGFVGDLAVNLIAPSSKTIKLHNRQGGNQKNLKKSFGKAELKELIGEKSKGKWILQIKDFAPKDSGTLKSWNLDLRI